MKPKLKYDSKNVKGLITCDTTVAAKVEEILGRCGYTKFNTIVEGSKSTVVVTVRDKADFKRLNSYWKSAKQFI